MAAISKPQTPQKHIQNLQIPPVPFSSPSSSQHLSQLWQLSQLYRPSHPGFLSSLVHLLPVMELHVRHLLPICTFPNQNSIFMITMGSWRDFYSHPLQFFSPKKKAQKPAHGGVCIPLGDDSFACLHDTEFCFCLKVMGVMWVGCFLIQTPAPSLLCKASHQAMGTKGDGYIFLEHLPHSLLPSLGRDLGTNWCFESSLFYSRCFTFFFFIVERFINTY